MHHVEGNGVFGSEGPETLFLFQREMKAKASFMCQHERRLFFFEKRKENYYENGT